MIKTKQALIIAAYTAAIATLTCCRKDSVADSDKATLYATPTQTELDSIYHNWQRRDLQMRDYSVVQQSSILNNKYTVKIVSYRVSGYKEYAALLVPNVDSALPVRMYIGGFGLDVTTNSVKVEMDTSSRRPLFIMAIPALRGQSLELSVNEVVYKTPLSEGVHCDAFDGGADDAIALLNVIEKTEPHADVNRTGVRGGSRGGTVALLAGIRDKRVKRVVGVAGPTDMMELTAQHENDGNYQCQFLNPLRSNTETVTAARNRLIASSPLYFAKYLPLTQMYMGLKDEKVPVSQAYKLRDAVGPVGMPAKFELFTFDRGHEDIATNNVELSERIEVFISGL